MQDADSPLRPRRTQAMRREESGRKLVQAAIAVAAEQGVSAATFQAISVESGYSRSLVTQRFGSKRGLTDAVIEHVRGSLEHPLETGGIHNLPGLNAILLYMDAYLTELTTNSEKRAYFMLLAEAVAEISDLRAIFAVEHERVRTFLRATLERGKADGSVSIEIDADAAALMIGSLQLGVAIQLLVDPNMNLEPVRTTTLNTLRRSFAA